MNLLLSLYLKNQFEVEFFTQWMLPSMFFDGNNPWEQRDVKSKFVIFAEKHLHDMLEVHPLVQLLATKTHVNLENVAHPENPSGEYRQDWWYETVYHKLATAAYADFVHGHLWAPLKANTYFREGSWNNIINIMRAGSINALLSRPIKLNKSIFQSGACIPARTTIINGHKYASKFFPDLIAFNPHWATSELHGFIDSPYFNIQESEGVMYCKVNKIGILQTSFLKWPVIVRANMDRMNVLNRLDKDFMTWHFSSEDVLRTLSVDEFGWVEAVEKIKDIRGFSYESKVNQVLEWCANGLNCHSIHRKFAPDIVQLWGQKKPNTTEGAMALMAAEFTMRKLLADAMNVG